MGCLVFLSLTLGGAGSAAGAGTDKAKPQPQNLWRSYPLDNAHRGQRQPGTPRPAASSRAERGGSGTGSVSTALVAAIAAAGLLAAATVAGLVLRLRGGALVVPAEAIGLVRAAARRIHRHEGGRIMASQGRKLWNRGKDHVAGGRPGMPERIAAEEASAGLAGATSVEAESQADLVDVGAEVGTVLKSAQEAAARIRQQARAEAASIRDEARAAAHAEVAEARRIAEAERAEAGRERAEAETDAQATRAEAETFGQQVRTSAEREADELLENARERLAHADAEVEKRLREAESDARRRRDALETESKLYEERLQKMLGVFQAMASQLEELLGRRPTAGPEADERGQSLEAALHPSAAETEQR